MREYRYGKSLKIFLFIVCLGLIALFGQFLFYYSSDYTAVYFFVILPMSLGMIGLAIYGIVDLAIGKIIITGDRVIQRTPFGYRMLMLDQIRGFRHDENYIRIFPLMPAEKVIKISTYVKDTDEIIEWLYRHYTNLSTVDSEVDVDQVLKNTELGITEEKRIERLQEARKISNIINGGAWILLVWAIFFPDYYYGYMVTTCCAYPWIVIFATLLYRGLISPDDYTDSKLPSLGVAFIIPGIALGLRAVTDFTILSHPPLLWVAIAFLSIIVGVLYMLPSYRLVSKRARFFGTGTLMILLSLFYSYGMLIEANCLLDRSAAVTYRTIVSGKRVESGKVKTYYLDLKPWGTLSDIQEVKVTYEHYESITEGDIVSILQHSGSLKIPWVEISN